MLNYFLICLFVLSSFSFSNDEGDITHIRFYISGDVKGETEPCGWKKKPAGGLARKCTVIKNSMESGYKTLVLDAGNLFFKLEKIDPGVSMDVAKENAMTIVKSFNYISCDAFSPGPKDFSAGLEFAKKLQQESNFDFISCNIADVNSNLIFKPYKIVEKENFKIGVIGASSTFVSDDIYVLDPFESIKNSIIDLKSKTDFIILLFSSSDQDYKKISKSDLDVDFVVRSNTRRKSRDGGNNVFPIYSTGDRGKVLYQFDFKSTNKVDPIVDLPYYNKLINLEKKRIQNMSSNADVSLIDSYNNNIEKYNNIINQAKNTIQVKQITLDKTIQDNPYVLKIVDEGKIKTRNLGGPMEDPHRWHNH